MGRLQFEGIATKNNDSRVSVLISEFDQAMQSNICQLKEPGFYIVL